MGEVGEGWKRGGGGEEGGGLEEILEILIRAMTVTGMNYQIPSVGSAQLYYYYLQLKSDVIQSTTDPD